MSRAGKMMAVVGVAFALATAGPAAANGCNGVVNQMVWGCAAWDNNNGPQYPNYKAPAKAAPAAAVVKPTAPAVAKPSGSPLLSPGAINGSSLISPGNRNGSGVISNRPL